MSTRSVRLRRGERAGKRARLAFSPVVLSDGALLIPAVLTLISGGYSNGRATLASVLFILLLGLVLVRSAIRRQPGAHSASSDHWAAYAGGLAALTATLATTELLGVIGRELYPLIYGLLAFLIAFNRRAIGLALVGSAAVMELVLAASTQWVGRHEPLSTVTHIALMGVFAGLQVAYESLVRPAAERAKRRRLSQTGQVGHLGPVSPAGPDGQVGQVGQIGALGQSSSGSAPDPPTEERGELVNAALALVRSTCEADSVSYLELVGDGSVLEVIASTTDADLGQRIESHRGIAASVLSAGQPVLANRLRSDFPGTPSGVSPPLPRHVLAAPVGTGRHMVGILLAQRQRGEAFGEAELNRITLATSLLNSSLLARRRMEVVTDAHYELARFFEASRLLNSALTPDEVYTSANEALRMIDEFEMAAITWAESAEQPQRVVHAWGRGLEALIGQRVDQGRTLASMVIKNGHYLPLGCDFKPGGVPVLSPKECLGGIRSLVVLPLRVHDQVRGTLTVGRPETDAFSDQRRGILEVIANQVAVSLSNARTYARVEEMATLDALTGLFNRRTFERRLGDGLARAGRGNNPLSLVLLDIDHFKNINDTYGHPTGDAVLRELGGLIRQLQRRTDLAARYGGEEFALILEDTACAGALVMAERLREEASLLTFSGPGGARFGMTVSLGIAAYPIDALDSQSLIDRADAALYEAKHQGRNQTRLARQLRPAPADLSELTGLDVSRSAAR